MEGNVGNELPWASVFDSTANMRALTAIQAEGFRAASKLVDRFIVAAADSVDTAGGTMGARSALSPDQRADLWGATDIEPLLKSWLAMMGQWAEGFSSGGGAGRARSAPEAPILEVSGGPAGGRVEVELAVGESGTAEIVLSNRGPADAGDLALRVSALESDTGAVLAPAAVVPDRVSMPGRSTRTVDLQITAGAAAGVYRGNLFVTGHPELWLPVVVRIGTP